MSLSSLFLPPADESDLVWRFGDAFRGDCGLRSNQGLVEDFGRHGIRIDTFRDPMGFSLDEDDRRLQAVRRLRRIDVRLSRTQRDAVAVLEAVYGPPGPRQPDGLHVFVTPSSGLNLGGVVLLSDEARDAHRRARSPFPLLEWLQRLSHRATGRDGAPTRASRRRDIDLAEALRLDAELRLVSAARAYVGTRRPVAEVRREH